MFRRRKRDLTPPVETDANELYQRAKAADRGPGPQDETEALLRRASELGHKVSMFDLGVLTERQHRLPEARKWFERARDAGHILAERKLQLLAEQDEAPDPELARLEEAASTGEPEAMTQYGVRLWAMGQRTPGVEWVRRAAESGHREAVRQLAWVNRHVPGEQERRLRQDAEHGDLEGLRPLAEYLRANHEPEAADVYLRLHELGDPWAAYQLARVSQWHGRIEEALRWYRAALTGSESATSARASLGALLTELSRIEEAEPLLRASAGMGDFHLGWILENRGELAEAEECYRGLVESDHDNAEALSGLARVLDRLGQHEEAQVCREEAEGFADLDGPGWPV